jgi:hypothetical protein
MEPVSHPRLSELVTGIGRAQVVKLDDFAVMDKSWVASLIQACYCSKPVNRNRKASWVLHHIFLRSPELIEPMVLQILVALDKSEDGSVHRELLKIMADVKVRESDVGEVGTELFGIAIELRYDQSQEKGMHYIAIRLIKRYIVSEANRKEALSAIRHMLAVKYSNEITMCNAAERAMIQLQ